MSSYRQILKSSSILGSSQAIGMLIGMVSVKIGALYLGPSGTGLIGNYQNILALVSGVAALGIGGAAVREMTLAESEKNEVLFAKNLQIMQRLLFFLGLLGWGILALSCTFISQWTFGNAEHAGVLAILGVNILFDNLTAGWNSRFQARRQIKRLAANKVIGGFLSLPIAYLFYSTLGKGGILPVLVLSALLGFFVAFWFGRKEKVNKVEFEVGEWKLLALKQIRLGVMLALTAVVASVSSWWIGAYITSSSGEWTNGIQRTAYGLSAFFVSFILSAMAGDYYPRLVGVIRDKAQASQIVREQLEIGVLLATPCILGGMVLCPFLIEIFYTNEYFAAVEPMRWFLVGCLLRVVSWPFGFVVLASGRTNIYATVEIGSLVIYVLLAILGFHWNSVIGLGMGFTLNYVIYTIFVIFISRKLIEFKFGREIYHILGSVFLAFIFSFLLEGKRELNSLFFILIGVTAIFSLYCGKILIDRMGFSLRKFLRK